jgi:hypothetical protein
VLVLARMRDNEMGANEGAPLLPGGGSLAHRSHSAPSMGNPLHSGRYGSVPPMARGAPPTVSNSFAWRRVRGAGRAAPSVGVCSAGLALGKAALRGLAAAGLCDFRLTENGNSPRQVYTLVLAAGMGGLLLGYNSSNIAVALPVRSRCAAPDARACAGTKRNACVCVRMCFAPSALHPTAAASHAGAAARAAWPVAPLQRVRPGGVTPQRCTRSACARRNARACRDARSHPRAAPHSCWSAPSPTWPPATC